MRFLGAVLVLPILVLPCRVAAQAAMRAGEGVALPIIEREGKWVCGAAATDDADIAVLAGRARDRFLAVQASLQSGRNQYIAESRRSFQEGLVYPTIAFNAVDFGRERLSGWPIPAPPPDSLPLSGFIANAEAPVTKEGGTRPTFFGPDPAYFLSGSFLGESCFRVVNTDLPPTLRWIYPLVPEGSVGLEFRAGPRSPKNSIRGVLWFNPQSADLETIEWSYVSARGGGWVDLVTLTRGGSFPLQWDVRTPVYRATPDDLSFGGVRNITAGFVILSGRITEVQDSSGVTIAQYRYRDW